MKISFHTKQKQVFPSAMSGGSLSPRITPPESGKTSFEAVYPNLRKRFTVLTLFLVIPILLTHCITNNEQPLDKILSLPELGYGENLNGEKWYVNGTSGNDTNTGSIDSPLKTIEAAQEKMSPGDTLILRKGIYIVESDGTKDFDLKLNVSGAGPDRKTTYRAYYDESTVTNPGPKDFERVILTGPIESGETQHRPPEIEIEGDYIRVEGIWFGGAWFAGNNDPVSGEPKKGSEFHAYGGGRLDKVREIENCTFFGFNGVRVGALEYSFWRNNRFIRNGTVNDLGDPPALYFSANHGPEWQATHSILDKNIFIRGTGYPIAGWHSWRNFIVTRNFIAKTWGGFVTDGPGSEAPGPYGPGKDHLIAHNVFWKTTERNSHNGATLISENLHFMNNILAGLYDTNADRPDKTDYQGTGGIGVDRNESSTMFYKNLRNLYVVDNAFYNLTIGMFSYPEKWTFTLDEMNDWTERNNAKKENYSPQLQTDALAMDGTVLNDGTEIDAVVDTIDTFFTTDMTTARLNTILNDATIEAQFEKLQSITVPENSPIYQKGDSWFEATKVSIGPDTNMPKTPAAFWQAFSKRGFYHYDQYGDRFVTP